MSHKVTFQSERVPLAEHPAVVAWQGIAAGPAPTLVEALTTPKGKHLGHKSQIFRLGGAAEGGAAVIAKRSRSATVALERMIYQEVLPTLPIRSLRCYGAAAAEESSFSWLFLEQAEGAVFNEEEPSHRVAAAEWFAIVHTGLAAQPWSSRLPAISTERYLSQLNMAIERTRDGMNNPGLTQSDQAMLRSIIAQCERLKESWDRVEAFCRDMPACLVHGDFIAKNVRVTTNSPTPQLLAIDWESAGWGVAVEDLGALDQTVADVQEADVLAYASRVRARWPQLDLENVRNLIALGTVLRYVCWIAPESLGLRHEWIEQTVQNLALYDRRLQRACALAAAVLKGGGR